MDARRQDPDRAAVIIGLLGNLFTTISEAIVQLLQ